MASLIGSLTFGASGDEEVDWHGFSYFFIAPEKESISRFSQSFGWTMSVVYRSYCGSSFCPKKSAIVSLLVWFQIVRVVPFWVLSESPSVVKMIGLRISQ
jgi:hypothetical protein